MYLQLTEQINVKWIASLLVCGVKDVREVEATFDFLVMLVDSSLRMLNKTHA